MFHTALQLTFQDEAAVLVLRRHRQGKIHTLFTRSAAPLKQMLNNLHVLVACCKMWDTESGEKLQDVEAHQGAILSCHVSPDGCLFATTSADRTAKVRRFRTHTHTLTGWDVFVCAACNNLTYYALASSPKPSSEHVCCEETISRA